LEKKGRREKPRWREKERKRDREKERKREREKERKREREKERKRERDGREKESSYVSYFSLSFIFCNLFSLSLFPFF
jgi:hypothetical protein